MPNDRVNGQFNQNTESKMLKKHSDGTAWKRRQELYRFCVFLDVWQHSDAAGILTPEEKWESTKGRRFPFLVVFSLGCDFLVFSSYNKKWDTIIVRFVISPDPHHDCSHPDSNGFQHPPMRECAGMASGRATDILRDPVLSWDSWESDPTLMSGNHHIPSSQLCPFGLPPINGTETTCWDNISPPRNLTFVV